MKKFCKHCGSKLIEARGNMMPRFHVGNLIMFEGTVQLVLDIEEEYYILGDLLNSPYEESEVVIDVIDEEGILMNIESAEEFLRLSDRPTSELHEGLKAFEKSRGKIWEKGAQRKNSQYMEVEESDFSQAVLEFTDEELVSEYERILEDASRQTTMEEVPYYDEMLGAMWREMKKRGLK